MHPLRSWSLLAMGLLSATAVGRESIGYPETRRVDQVDDYHGTKVADPYRWLEVDVRQSPEVAAWIERQNNVTQEYLESLPARKAISQRLTELWNYERYSSPSKVGGRYFYLKNDGLQNQSVLYTMDSLAGTPRLLLDPNQWSKDGTLALAGISVSDDATYLAYGVAEAGSDWQTWHVLEVSSGRVLSDELKWVKFGNTSWTRDNQGFFYSRYDAPAEGNEYQALNLNQKLFYHRVGTPQSEDVLVYRRPDHPEWGFSPEVSEDGRFLVITIWKGTDDKYRIVVKDLSQPYSMPVDLIDHFDHEYTFVGNDGSTLFFKSDREAPRRRLIALEFDPLAALPEVREVISEMEDTLTSVHYVDNLFIAVYLKDAATRVRLFTMEGQPLRDVELPAIGTAEGFAGRQTDTETFYSFSSFATPPSIYRYDMVTGKSDLFRQPKVGFNPDDYEVKQVFFSSRDGTRVPMFIAHKKGLPIDGTRPTLLYGYGGFAVPLTPSFSVARLAWMEMGGVFAMANLRGGGEYGEAWHQAGTKQQKQNVFDDFIAAAEWLIENRYTRPDKLAIQGGSNGGLLVGAAVTQRPDLFGACLPAVGVMDMLRFHKFTSGRFWVDDYGSADDPEQFKALLAYSPYHNLREGTHYPPTLITTADTDDRVVPAHSFKFAAALQRAQAGPAPVLIRIETRAGHGAGKPTSKLIEEVADQLAFLAENLGLERRD